MSHCNDFFAEIGKIANDLSSVSALNDSVAAIPLICSAACSYIIHGKDSPNYNKALAYFLSIAGEDSEKLVTGIACIYVMACQENNIFSEINKSLQIPDPMLKIITDCFLEHKKELALVSEAYEGVEYRGLQWRLQTQVASRSQLTSVRPRALLRLQLCSAGEPISVALTSDIPNLVHWSEMIEQALAEGRTQHARKVHRVVTSGKEAPNKN